MRLEKVEKQKSHSRERNLEREHALFHSLGLEVLSCLQSGEAQIRGRIAGPGGGAEVLTGAARHRGGWAMSLSELLIPGGRAPEPAG